MPTGLLLITLSMTLMDWANIRLTPMSLAIVSIAFLAASIAVNLSYIRQIPQRLASPFKQKGQGLSLNLTWFNLLWLLMFMAVAYLEAVNYTKCLMYPTYDRDSMAAFDTIGFVCAQEHTYHAMSIFQADYFPQMHDAGSSMSYMPMIQLSYAYVYSFGAFTSKAVPAYIYLGFLIGMYGLCRRRLSHTSSMLVLLGIILTPEMTAFASHSITNVMQACMASTGLLYTCLWLHTKQRRDLWLSVILLATNSWMRTEGIVFVGVAWLVVAIKSARTKQWRESLVPLAALLPFVVWTLYSHSCGLTSESALITHPFWDADKAAIVTLGMWELFSGGTFYGWTFNIMVLALIADLYFVVKRKSTLWPLVALALCIGSYYLLLYQIDYKWDSIYNVLAYSAKRFNFCFVPVAWYITASTYPVRTLTLWLERHIGLGLRIDNLHLHRRKD